MSNAYPIVLSTEEEVGQFRVVENGVITGLPNYNYFEKRAYEGFQIFCKANPEYEHRPYQYEYGAMMAQRRFNVMGWSPGVGKTLASLLTIYALYKEELESKTLRVGAIHIVPPSRLAAQQWVKELSAHPTFVDLFEELTSAKAVLNISKPILIYTHDFPKRTDTAKKTAKKHLIAKRLKDFCPRLLVIDELHDLRTESQRSKALLMIRKNSRRVLGLTGTISDGSLDDVHRLMRFVYLDFWPYEDSRTFSQYFGRNQKVEGNYLYGSIKRSEAPPKYLRGLDPSKIPESYKLMRRYLHRVNDNDPNIRKYITVPKGVHHLHGVPADKDQLAQYNEFINQKASSLLRLQSGRHGAEALQIIHPLREIANRGENKLAKLVELVKQSSGKVVVFCDLVSSSRLCTERLSRELGEEAVVRLYSRDPLIDKKTLTEDERIDIKNRFQYDPAVKAGVFSINLCNQSIDLNRASDVIYYCQSWSSLKILQSLSRAVRSGNPNSEIGLHHLFNTGLIDEYQIELAIKKIEGILLLLDYDISDDEVIEDDLSPSAAIQKLLGKQSLVAALNS